MCLLNEAEMPYCRLLETGCELLFWLGPIGNCLILHVMQEHKVLLFSFLIPLSGEENESWSHVEKKEKAKNRALRQGFP